MSVEDIIEGKDKRIADLEAQLAAAIALADKRFAEHSHSNQLLIKAERDLSTARAERDVPGMMRCAKCNFVLTRTNLYVNSGTTGPGDNKTELCPNGCGPLWPLTWVQHANDGWRRCEEMMEERNAARAEAGALRADALRWRAAIKAAPTWGFVRQPDNEYDEWELLAPNELIEYADAAIDEATK